MHITPKHHMSTDHPRCGADDPRELRASTGGMMRGQMSNMGGMADEGAGMMPGPHMGMMMVLPGLSGMVQLSGSRLLTGCPEDVECESVVGCAHDHSQRFRAVHTAVTSQTGWRCGSLRV